MTDFGALLSALARAHVQFILIGGAAATIAKTRGEQDRPHQILVTAGQVQAPPVLPAGTAARERECRSGAAPIQLVEAEQRVRSERVPVQGRGTQGAWVFAVPIVPGRGPTP